MSGELIMSRYVAESITTDAGHLGHVGLSQLRTKLFALYAVDKGLLGQAVMYTCRSGSQRSQTSSLKCYYVRSMQWHGLQLCPEWMALFSLTTKRKCNQHSTGR